MAAIQTISPDTCNGTLTKLDEITEPMVPVPSDS
jgi:hypothetical protein